jgi:outer membrane protein assembly factor BamD (BamD/ComL family)
MKKLLFILMLFLLPSLSQAETLYHQGLKELKSGQYGKAVKSFVDDCNNYDIKGCLLLPVAAYTSFIDKTVTAAESWLEASK